MYIYKIVNTFFKLNEIFEFFQTIHHVLVLINIRFRDADILLELPRVLGCDKRLYRPLYNATCTSRNFV